MLELFKLKLFTSTSPKIMVGSCIHPATPFDLSCIPRQNISPKLKQRLCRPACLQSRNFHIYLHDVRCPFLFSENCSGELCQSAHYSQFAMLKIRAKKHMGPLILILNSLAFSVLMSSCYWLINSRKRNLQLHSLH